MLENNYWRVVLRYCHVGLKRDVAVARYIDSGIITNSIQIMDLAKEMPGVKHRGVLSISKINSEAYQSGKTEETNNFYLLKMFNHGCGKNSKKIIKNRGSHMSGECAVGFLYSMN